MVEGVVAVDRAGRILHVNESAAKILRVRREAKEGQHLYEVTRVTEVGDLLRETLADGKERREEVRGLRFTYEPPELRFFQARFERLT